MNEYLLRSQYVYYNVCVYVFIITTIVFYRIDAIVLGWIS